MKEIEKRLQEIELELKALYTRALDVKDERIGGESGWFWLEGYYNGISNVTWELAAKCANEFIEFRKREISTKEKRDSVLFALAESLVSNAPWGFDCRGLGVLTYSFEDFRLYVYLNHLACDLGNPKVNISYKGEYIGLTDYEQESLCKLWFKKQEDKGLIEYEKIKEARKEQFLL